MSRIIINRDVHTRGADGFLALRSPFHSPSCQILHGDRGRDSQRGISGDRVPRGEFSPV